MGSVFFWVTLYVYIKREREREKRVIRFFYKLFLYLKEKTELFSNLKIFLINDQVSYFWMSDFIKDIWFTFTQKLILIYICVCVYIYIYISK